MHHTIPRAVARFRQDLQDCLQGLSRSGLTPSSFRGFVRSLQDALNQLGLDALIQTLTAFDDPHERIDREGEVLRFKFLSTKEWLSPFGLVSLPRRLYQADSGGCAVVPLDEQCGMVDHFMTPDIEEMCTFAGTMLVPREVETLLGMILPHGPSATAIQHGIHDVGSFAEEHHYRVEDAIHDDQPLCSEGHVVVVSADGVTVPLREKGMKPGRKADRPGVRDSEESPTAWKEASVATISIYDGNQDEQTRLDTRYYGRMPESGMVTLMTQVGLSVAHLRDEHEVRELVLLCDGKKALWNSLAKVPSLDGATQILDFYHASQHLSKAAEAIFGKRNGQASRWHEKYRAILKEREDGAEATLRSLRYYLRKLRAGTERAKTVQRVINYLRNNMTRIQYAEFRSRGLPIGSGPVEAACKNLVGARLKRSGMRWSTEGGQEILNLRAQVLSGRWNSLWETYIKDREMAA